MKKKILDNTPVGIPHFFFISNFIEFRNNKGKAMKHNLRMCFFLKQIYGHRISYQKASEIMFSSTLNSCIK